MRRCVNKMQYVPMESMDKCKVRSDMVKGNIRFIKNGFLYVDVDNNTIKIKNPYGYEPKNVEIVKRYGQYYVKGFIENK